MPNTTHENPNLPSARPLGSARPWFIWGERELTIRERVRLLLGARLYVRFDAPSGQCSAACDLSHQVTHNKIGAVVWPNSEIDATIPCDDMGNLTVPWNWNGQAPNKDSATGNT